MNPWRRNQLRNAVEAGDWVLAADVCREIALGASSEREQEQADTLTKAVRFEEAAAVAAIIEEMEA